MRSIFLLLLVMTSNIIVSAQEFNCIVEVNSESIEGFDRNIFDELKHEIETYVNDFRWTDYQFGPKERIDCRIFITIKDYSGGNFKGEIQIQLSRPVFNSNYTTSLFNFRDTDFEFQFHEGEHLTHSENMWDGNLKGIIDFYSLLMLGIDSDSFSLYGGQEFFDRASKIVQQAQTTGEKGWKYFDSNNNRGAIIGVFTDRNTIGFRELLYRYHRKGLDQMSTSLSKGRAEIADVLKNISEIYKVSPSNVSISIFRDTKLDELTEIFSKAPKIEKKDVTAILKEIYPMDNTRIDRILVEKDSR